MFRPLADTKTLAITFSRFWRSRLCRFSWSCYCGRRLRPEEANPVSRFFQRLYLPVIRWCLRHRWLTIAVNLVFLVVTLPLALSWQPVHAAVI